MSESFPFVILLFASHFPFQAIRDGVIEAAIDHEQGFMKSKVRLLLRLTSEAILHMTNATVRWLM